MGNNRFLRLVGSESLPGLEGPRDLLRDRALAEITNLGLTTRDEVIAYFHDFHGWPMNYIVQEATKVGMGYEETLDSLEIGRVLLGANMDIGFFDGH